MLRNWGLVFVGNFAGAMTVAVMMAIIFTIGFTVAPNAVGQKIGQSAKAARVGYADARRRRHAHAVHPRRAVQLDGLDRRRRRDDVDHRHGQGHRDVDADPGVLLHGFRALHRQHVPVPVGPDAWRQLHLVMDYLLWNEIPTVVGNLVGGLTFVGRRCTPTHYNRSAPKRTPPDRLPAE